MCGREASYQVTRAKQLASGCGTESFADMLNALSVPESAASKSLADSEDITESILQLDKKEGPSLPPCHVLMPKAAILGFQTWYTRTRGIVGLLLGNQKKKSSSLQRCSIVVGTNFKDLLASEKVKTVCSREELHVCGVIMGGESSSDEDREMARTWTSHVLGEGSLPVACVMVPWNQPVLYMYISIGRWVDRIINRF